MRDTIAQRTTRWAIAIWNINDRGPRVSERLAEAKDGVFVMLLAGAALIGIGAVAAWVVNRITEGWRVWLVQPLRRSYWDKVVRTAALGVLEFLPIVAFVIATRLAAPLMADQLGPLSRMIWIYHTGVSYSWLLIVFTRRAFAPDAPEIRIAPLTDENATHLHSLLRRAFMIGADRVASGGVGVARGSGFSPGDGNQCAGRNGNCHAAFDSGHPQHDDHSQRDGSHLCAR